MHIKRDIEDGVKKYIHKPEIIAVVGPRQSGKTTLLKQLFKSLKKAVYVDFEDRDILNLFNNDIKSFYSLKAAEIDFVIEDREANIAVEVKSVLSSHKTGKAVYNFREKYTVDKIIILSENLSFIDRERRINFLPIFFI